MRTLFLCGGGNPDGVRLAQRINEQRRRWGRMVVLDDDPAKQGHSVLGVSVAGGFDRLTRESGGSADVANLVARTSAKRWSARSRIQTHGLPFATLIHPGVDTAGATLADEIIIYQNATIGAEAQVGEGTVVFMGAVVGHECRVGRGCIVASNAVLNARVELGEGVYVGTNATVLPEVRVGAWATVGAGSVVLEDVPPGATVMGVPAEMIACPADARSNGPSPLRAGDRATPIDLERVLRGVWEDLLERACLDPDQNFFDLGGDSHLALQVHARVRQLADCDLRITDMYRFPTIRSLAGYLAEVAQSSAALDTNSRADLRRRMMQRRAAG